MRITKKFSRTRLIGKSSYKRAGEASPDEIATLEGARRAFRRHAELPDESEGERPPVQLDAWVTTQGFDPSEMAGGNLEHGCADPPHSPRIPPKSRKTPPKIPPGTPGPPEPPQNPPGPRIFFRYNTVGKKNIRQTHDSLLFLSFCTLF